MKSKFNSTGGVLDRLLLVYRHDVWLIGYTTLLEHQISTRLYFFGRNIDCDATGQSSTTIDEANISSSTVSNTILLASTSDEGSSSGISSSGSVLSNSQSGNNEVEAPVMGDDSDQIKPPKKKNKRNHLNFKYV